MAVTATFAPVLYYLAKYWVRAGLWLYCRQTSWKGLENISKTAPLIIAANHPNSFFDALLVGTFMPRQCHFLARGDAFKNPLVARILYALKLIPIYRLSEGKENMSKNTDSFNASIEVMKKGGAVLIFSEGLCENEWKLRPLKKGTARLAWQAWVDEGITNMEIVPLAINYNSYRHIPKYVWMETGKAICQPHISQQNPSLFFQEVNGKLEAELARLVLVKNDLEDIPVSKSKLSAPLRLLLALPAAISFLVHFPLKSAAHALAWRKTKGTVFYDAVFFAILTFTYPFALAVFGLATGALAGALWGWAAVLLLPLFAKCRQIWITTTF